MLAGASWCTVEAGTTDASQSPPPGTAKQLIASVRCGSTRVTIPVLSVVRGNEIFLSLAASNRDVELVRVAAPNRP
jgi:hypothetical protein